MTHWDKHRAEWKSLDPKLRERAVNQFLKVDGEEIDWVRKHIERTGNEWEVVDINTPEELAQLKEEYGFSVPAIFHMSSGMAIRNWLRDEVKDEELPSGNWDDYYGPCVEEALGIDFKCL